MDLKTTIHRLADIHREFPWREGLLSDLLAQYGDTPEGAASIPPHLWPRSFRVHIAAMIAIVCSALIPKGSPRLGFAFNANESRSGKTLLANLTIAPAYGWVKVRTWPANDRARTDEAEIRKSIDAVTLEAQPYLLFDNVKGVVMSDSLEALMTSPMWTGRVMGANNKTFTAEHHTSIILTGTHLRMGDDNMNRFLWVDLNVEEVDPRDRNIKNPIDQAWVVANHQELLDLLMVLVLHWVEQKEPRCTGRVYRGFEVWCHTIGGIIEAAGLGDIFEKREEDNSTSGSPDQDDMRKLCHHLLEDLTLDERTHGWKFDEIVQICHEHGWLERFLDGKEEREGDGEHSRTKLVPSAAARSKFGNFLKKFAPLTKGRVWHFHADEKHPYPRTCRLQTVGEDRTREYVARLEVTPVAELKANLFHAGVQWHDLVPILEENGLPIKLEDLSALDVSSLNAQWKPLILPRL